MNPEKIKSKSYFMIKAKDEWMIIEQKNSLEEGYIWVPYIPMTTTTIVSEYSSKNVIRRRKINKIFNLGLDIKDEFSPSKSISSRYSAVKISNDYSTIFLEGVI